MFGSMNYLLLQLAIHQITVGSIEVFIKLQKIRLENKLKRSPSPHPCPKAAGLHLKCFSQIFVKHVL